MRDEPGYQKFILKTAPIALFFAALPAQAATVTRGAPAGAGIKFSTYSSSIGVAVRMPYNSREIYNPVNKPYIQARTGKGIELTHDMMVGGQPFLTLHGYSTFSIQDAVVQYRLYDTSLFDMLVSSSTPPAQGTDVTAHMMTLEFGMGPRWRAFPSSFFTPFVDVGFRGSIMRLTYDQAELNSKVSGGSTSTVNLSGSYGFYGEVGIEIWPAMFGFQALYRLGNTHTWKLETIDRVFADFTTSDIVGQITFAF